MFRITITALATLTSPLLVPTALSAPPTSGLTEAEARKLLARPAGSISLGMTNGGSLLEAVALAEHGKGYAIFRPMRSRETRYGTRELIDLIERATRHVAERYPGSILGVGNLGFKNGGKIPWSVSHQAGRDADLGFYARDARDRPVELDRMLYFDESGTTGDKRYRFDTERNLALVRAMVEDPEVAVHYIFVAAWLKRLMLDEAERQGTPPEVVARLAEVLHQPSDSNPHADHFHVRVFCTVADRLQGCRNRGPNRDWVDTGDGPWGERVELLARAVREVPSLRVRRDAIERIAELRGLPALPTLIDTLASPDKELRAAALRAVRTLATLDATDGLLAALRATPDPSWATSLFSAVLAPAEPAVAEVALRAVTAAEELLHPGALSGALTSVLVASCRTLARYGRAEAAPPLLALLESRVAEVRLAAHEALLRITNQRIAGAGLASSSARRRATVLTAWRRFLDAQQEASWLHWLRTGFEVRGIRFGARMASRVGVERLIDAIAHADAIVSDNAVRALSEITGHYVDPAWRNKRNNQRHWRAWWSANGDQLGLQ